MSQKPAWLGQRGTTVICDPLVLDCADSGIAGRGHGDLQERQRRGQCFQQGDWREQPGDARIGVD